MRLSASILALGLALTACSGDQTAGNGGGTVIAGMGGDPSSLFPSLAQDETAFAVGDLLFEKLAAIGPSLSSVGDKDFTPRLAQSWDWARDSMSITFHLNPAARFHDGTPVTANDVRYTFRIIKDTALGSTFTSLIANIDSVTVVDSLTPVFWYHRRTATQFFDAVYQVAPVPEHIYGKVPVAELKTSDITKNPVGTGRFRFVRYEPGTRIELVADTANFLGRPRLDRVIFMIGQNPPTASQSVLAGQMDFYVAFPIDQVDRLDSSTVARPILYEQNGYGFAGINMFARKSTTVPHPILSDVRVRRALSMSLDRRAMLTNVFKSTGRLAYGPFPTGVALSDSSIGPPPYDTAAAGRLLDEAGWKRGPNGVRMKNGKPLEIEILAPSTSLIRIRYADLMQDQLNRVGFKAEVARAAMAEFGPRAGSRDYDMIVLAVNTDPSVAGIQQFWSSAGIPAGSNFMNYANRKVDAALDSATWAPTLAARSAYLTRAFRQIIDDAPAVWLYSASVTAAINRRIEAPTLPRNGWWNNLAEWSIPADKRIDRDRVGLRPTATP